MALDYRTGANMRYAMALMLLVAISLVARVDFLAFHLVAELFSVIVGFLVFSTAVGSYRFHRNAYLLILGCAYFWVAVLDLCHALTYKGMGLFGVAEANTATQLWLAARLLEAGALAGAPLFLLRQRPLSTAKVMALFGWITAALWLMVITDVMPAAYIEGEGLTPFKVACEWVVISALVIALAAMVHRRALLPQPSFWPLAMALVLTIATELLFTLYVGVSGTLNLVGHLTKFLSSWLVLEALVASTFSRPFEMIARTADSFDGVPDPVMLIDTHGLVVQVNKAGRQWLGLPISDLAGRPLVDVLRLDPGADATIAISKAITERASLQDLEAMEQGRQRALLLSMVPFWSSGDDAIMVVSLRDTTQRRSTERALKIAKQRSEMALINGGQGLWDWNIKTGDVFFSPAMETMLGYSPGSWEPKVSAWERLVHPDDLPRVMRDLSSHLDGTTDHYDNTHRLRHKDGHWVWVHDRGRVVETDHHGHPVRAIGTHTDVSTSIAREARLSSANAELQSFAASISQDLKAPLQAIAEQIDLAKKALPETAPAEAIGYLGQARGGADRLRTMIDGLLDYARVDSEEITSVQVDLNLICSKAIRSQEALILQTDAQISQGPSFPMALCDPAMMQRVMTNLLNNALKFHRPGEAPSIALNAWHEGQNVVLEISDQGLGVARQDTQIIFEIFQRGSTSAPIASLGVGLAIAKRCVERMGGQLDVRLNQGAGTTFLVTLPAPQGPLQALAAARSQTLPQTDGTL